MSGSEIMNEVLKHEIGPEAMPSQPIMNSR